MRTPSSAATYSALAVLWETQVCRRLEAEMAHRVLGPCMRTTTPEVLRLVRWHPAKSAST
eukprot:8065378-Prorocentrum_lima.AAC.1